MKKLSGLLLLFLLISSCKKETNDFLWERSFGAGDAVFVSSAPDSGIVACGEINGNPYLIKLSKDKRIITSYTSGRLGSFSSVWYGDSCFIAGGSSDGKILLAKINYNGSLAWDTVILTRFNIGLTNLSYTGEGTFIAIGSGTPSSYETSDSGFVYLRFDTACTVLKKKHVPIDYFASANNFTTDNQGNIFVALTRKTGSAKTRACVAKYNSDLRELWETELYNNKSFGAASYDVMTDQNGNVYITGKTEVPREIGTLDNSFLACLAGNGTVIWKKYLENSNSGVAIVIDDSDRLWMLNKNCFIISKFIIDATGPDNITDEGLIRMFSVCDSYNTDAFGADMDLNYNGNILTSGSRGGNFFLAVKSSSQ